MTNPISVAIPHSLPREELRSRMNGKLASLSGYLPGNATVNPTWASEDRLVLDIAAMGQQLQATVDIEDKAVRVTAQLPGMLGMFAGAIESAIRTKGEKFLIGQRTEDSAGR